MAADVRATSRAQVLQRSWRPHWNRRWMRTIGWRHLVALAFVVFALFPVVWVVSASFNPTGSLANQRLIPEGATVENFRVLLRDTAFTTWLKNTVIIAGVASALQILMSAFAAYAFSRLRFRGRRSGLLGLLLVQMFPQLLAVVAIFLMMVNIKGVFPEIGLGTRSGLILVYLGGSLGINTWLMKGFFDTIPKELDEVAIVDGASHAQAFWLVIFPLVRPMLAVLGLLAFVFAVNEFVIASALLRGTGNETLSVGLQQFIDDRYGNRWGPFAAGALIGGVPIIVLFLLLQRFIVSGLTAGSVKG